MAKLGMYTIYQKIRTNDFKLRNAIVYNWISWARIISRYHPFINILEIKSGLKLAKPAVSGK